MTLAYEQIAQSGGIAATRQAGGLFMPDNPRRSLRRITSKLTELGVEHALVDGLKADLSEQ